MLQRVPSKLPENGPFKALYAWLNRLRESVLSGQIQTPHGIKRIQGPQGVLLEGNFGAAGPAGEPADDDLTWI